MFVRGPSPDITQWDNNACETACTAQLLYMCGMLEAKDAPSVDRYVGRQRGSVDVSGGNIRFLLQKGFVIQDLVGAFDSVQAVGPRGIEYVRAEWRKAGHSERKISEYLPDVYPLLRDRLLGLLRLERESGGRFVTVTKEPTYSDFLESLRKGPVGLTLREKNTKNGHMILVTQQTGPTECEIYDPQEGVVEVKLFTLKEYIKGGFRGFSLP